MITEPVAEDLTTLDQLELSRRLQAARDEVNDLARHVANLVLDGGDDHDLLPFALRRYAAAKDVHAALAAENSRRCDEYRRRGLV